MDSDSWIILISIVLLVAGSAFFSASWAAVSTFNKMKMKKLAASGDARAALVLAIIDGYDRSVSAILIGKNIAHITAGSLATVFAAARSGIAGIAAAIAVTLALMLLFGEILPRSYAREHADKTALALAKPLNLAIKILSPASFLLTKLSRILRGPAGERAPSITEEELIYMMGEIEEEGVLEEQERDLVQSALEFDEISLKEILTPRVNIIAADVEAAHDEIMKLIIDEGYSRIPIYEKTIDNIIGVLYSRDYLVGVVSGETMSLREMLGETLFVHKSMKLSHLLASFKANKRNLAVVVDEYGGTLGIVTMEDMLEELVGDIWDEDDEIPSGFVSTGADSFEADGSHELGDMLERLEISTQSDFEHSTVGGWALHMLGHMPQTGESFVFDKYAFTVLDMDGHRLKRLGISPAPQILDEKDLNRE